MFDFLTGLICSNYYCFKSPPKLFHAPFDIPFLLTLLYLLSFIVLSLTRRKGKLGLGQASAVKVYPKRHKSKAPLGEFDLYFGDLPFVQKQLSISFGFVVIVCSLGVRGDFAPD
jgi:hypothetical protein